MITVYLDTETGGIKPEHPTIQLAAVAVDGETELGHFEHKIAFKESDADPDALAMNHYTREAWINAMPGPVVASRFAAWLRPYCQIERISRAGNPYRIALAAAYNAPFDSPRVQALFGTQFCPISYHVRDVLQRALFWFDEHPEAAKPADMKLTTVAAHFGLETGGAHDALADARLCAAVAKSMRDADMGRAPALRLGAARAEGGL